MKELHKLKKMISKFQIFLGMFAVVFALAMCVDDFSMVSHAESQGKVTAATNAKIRKEASTASESLGSAKTDSIVTILGETRGADGYVWYQVIANGNINGYIRSDLIAVIEEDATVEKLNPVSGTVTGGTVRVRSNASTNSDIVENVTEGTALTITGRANGTDGKVWYFINFIAQGEQVEGFIRSDFVDPSGELTPYVEPTTPTAEPTPPSTTTPEPSTPAVDTEPEKKSPYHVAEQDGVWYLVKTATNEGWEIDALFSGASGNTEVYEQSLKTVKSQKVVIIILVLILVAAGAAIAFLIFKNKDMMDSAYFKEVEAETIRRRNAAATQGNKRVMLTVGEEKKAAHPAQGQRPSGNSQGAKPQGNAQGQRPQGSKPQGSAQGQRPQGAPQGQRPQGSAQGQRPQGASQGQRPQGSAQGQRPLGAPQGQRPAAPQTAKPGAPQGAKPTAPGTAKPATPQTAAQDPKAQNKQPRNFMVDEDDEFEFEFLNYDGDDE